MAKNVARTRRWADIKPEEEPVFGDDVPGVVTVPSGHSATGHLDEGGLSMPANDPEIPDSSLYRDSQGSVIDPGPIYTDSDYDRLGMMGVNLKLENLPSDHTPAPVNLDASYAALTQSNLDIPLAQSITIENQAGRQVLPTATSRDRKKK